MKKTAVYVLLLGVLVSCSSEVLISDLYLTGYREEFSVDDSVGDVCILYYPTEFKKAMMYALSSNLNELKLNVVADNMSNCAVYDPDDYSAVVLLSQVQAFQPLPPTVTYITYHDYSANIIYVSTWSAFNKTYVNLDQDRIDAITCASVEVSEPEFETIRQSVVSKISDVIGN